MININNDRLAEIIKDTDIQSITKKGILYTIFDFNLQKQHNDIPKVFKVPTYLFTRLDMDVQSIIKLNFHRKEIAHPLLSLNFHILLSKLSAE